MATKAIIITHGSDLDGIASHAILTRYLMGKLWMQEIDHLFVEYYNVEKTFEELKKKIKKPPYDIYVADFNITERIFDKVFGVINELLNKGCKFFWYDHHKWNPEQLKKMQEQKVKGKKVIEIQVDQEKEKQKKKCGADLVYERFMRDDDISKKLQVLAHDRDIWIRNYLDGMKFNMVCSDAEGNIKKQMRLVEKFVEYDLEGDIRKKAEKMYKYFQEKSKEAFKETYIVSREIKFKLIKKTDRKLENSDLAASFFDIDKDCRVLCVWERTAKKNEGHLRRAENEKEIDVSAIAKKLGGGGGEAAAGFRVKEKTTKELVERIRNAIKEAGYVK